MIQFDPIWRTYFSDGWFNHQLDQFYGSVMGVYTTWVFWEILYVPGWAWRVWCTFHAWKPNSHCQGKPKSAHHLFGNPRKLKMIDTPKWIWMDQKWPKLWFFSWIFSDTLWIISKNLWNAFWWSGWWWIVHGHFSRKWRCKLEKLLEFGDVPETMWKY